MAGQTHSRKLHKWLSSIALLHWSMAGVCQHQLGCRRCSCPLYGMLTRVAVSNGGISGFGGVPGCNCGGPIL